MSSERVQIVLDELQCKTNLIVTEYGEVCYPDPAVA